ncbi:recombination regulator RecX [Methylophilaceae bacterium]|nr:recombination regulator RecX [Methylophilaceae bacterium]
MNNLNKNQLQLKKRALYYLGKRDYSRVELRKKISTYSESLEISKVDLELLLDELEAKDWLSDDRFSEQFVLSRKRKFGARKIAHELKLRGVDESIISRVLRDIKDDEFLLAKTIWEKKFNQIPITIDEKAKQIRFMQSRGIDVSIIHQILSGKSPEFI